MAIDVDFRIFSETKFQASGPLGQRIRKRASAVTDMLWCYNEESRPIKVLGLRSGVGGGQRRPQLAHKTQEVLRCQAVQALIHRHACQKITLNFYLELDNGEMRSK